MSSYNPYGRPHDGYRPPQYDPKTLGHQQTLPQQSQSSPQSSRSTPTQAGPRPNPPLGNTAFAASLPGRNTSDILLERMQKDRDQRIRLGYNGDNGQVRNMDRQQLQAVGAMYSEGRRGNGNTAERLDSWGRPITSYDQSGGSEPLARQDNIQSRDYARQPYSHSVYNPPNNDGRRPGPGPSSSGSTQTANSNSSQVFSLGKLSSLFDGPPKIRPGSPAQQAQSRQVPQTEPLRHAVPHVARPEVTPQRQPRPTSAPHDPRPALASPKSPLNGSRSNGDSNSNAVGGIDMLLRAAAERVSTPSTSVVANPMESAGKSVQALQKSQGSKDVARREMNGSANGKRNGSEDVDMDVVAVSRPKETDRQPRLNHTDYGDDVDVEFDQILQSPSQAPKPRRKSDKASVESRNRPNSDTVKKDQPASSSKSSKNDANRSFSSDDSELTSLSDDDPDIVFVQPSGVALTNGTNGSDQPRKSGRQRKPNTRLIDQVAHDQETRKTQQRSVEPSSRPGSGSSASRPKRMASDAAQAKIDQAVEKFGPVRSGAEHVRSRTAEELYDLEQELAETGVKQEVMHVDPVVHATASPSIKRKRSTPEVQHVPEARRKPVDVDADYSDSPRASPKRTKVVKRKPIVVQSDSDEASPERSARYTSPIHGRRKVQRRDYTEVQPQGLYDGESPDVTVMEAPIDIDRTRPTFDGQGTSGDAEQAMANQATMDLDFQLQPTVMNGKKPEAVISTRTGQAKPRPQEYKPDLGPEIEIQHSSCLNKRYYTEFPRCGVCVAKKTNGEKCRFINWRLFPVNPDSGVITGQPYFGSVPLRPPVPLQYPEPDEFNRIPTAPDAFYLQQTVVRWLLPLFAREVQHVVQDGAMCKVDDEDSRLVCDFCATTVFGGSWACKHCAKEYCFECKGLLFDFKGPDDLKISASSWQKDAGTRLLRCTTVNSTSRIHYGSCLLPVTRYDPAELKRDWAALVGFVTQSQTAYGETLPDLALPFQQHLQAVSAIVEAGDKPRLPGQEAEEARARATSAVFDLDSFASKETSPSQPVDPAGLGSHAFFRLANDKLSDAVFDAMWSKGIPLVVDGLAERFKLDWTPQSFYERTDHDDRDQVCYVVDCQAHEGADGSLTEMRVADFFAEYMKGSQRDEETVKKLKDWPAYTEFREKFPDLYDDFHQAMPVPDYTRRDGVLNISAHFPQVRGPPDIGPKMYNAFAAHEGPGGQGSTRLHLDMADAINVLTHANPRADGSPGCAVWDIFRPEDADGLREFLLEKYAGLYRIVDPIHSQQFYLDSQGRQELFEKKGIVSYRIYQYPGQAIMVPAGCAHQVCNLADCIKIACDFVSPQNVKRCEKLSREFRNENSSKVWKDDVLQLSNMNWYAWSSSRALTGYKEEVTATQALHAEIEHLFSTLPRETRLECDKTVHDLTLLKHAPFKDPLGRPPVVKVAPIRQQTIGRRSVKRAAADSPMNAINLDVEMSASPAPPHIGMPYLTSSSVMAGPSRLPFTPSADQQARLRGVLDRMAEEVVEAGCVSDLTNKDVVKGILAVAIRRSGLVLPEGFGAI